METGSKEADKMRGWEMPWKDPEHDVQTSEGFRFCCFGVERHSGETMVYPEGKVKKEGWKTSNL